MGSRGRRSSEPVRVTLSLQAFRTLLQRGVGIPLGTTVGVRQFLQESLGIDATYVEERLQTVFLDGHPVDDLDGIVVSPGAVLALSGAMPGLAGATMRRGGYYARLREGITHSGADGTEGGEEAGIVIVKLFNRPLADLAESLAARPLLVPVDALAALDAVEAAEALADLAVGDALGKPDAPEPGAPDGGWVRVTVTLSGGGQT